MLRCGFLVTSYPRFFRGTGCTGPGLEWLQRAGSEGAQRGTVPLARLDRRASLGPVLSAVPMVLEQTWHREKPRSGAPSGQAGPRALQGTAPGPRTRPREQGWGPEGLKAPAPPLLAATCARSPVAVRRPRQAQGKAKASPGSRSMRVTAASPLPSFLGRSDCAARSPRACYPARLGPLGPSPPEPRPAPRASVSAAPAVRQAGRGASGPCFSPANGWTGR